MESIKAPYLREEGPIIPITLKPIPEYISALRDRGDIPKELIVKALIDTGASFSAVAESVAGITMGLLPTGAVEVWTIIPGHQYLPVYPIQLVMPDYGVETVMDFIGVPEMFPNVGVILGRDFLEKCIFNYDGIGTSFTLRCLFNKQ